MVNQLFLIPLMIITLCIHLQSGYFSYFAQEEFDLLR